MKIWLVERYGIGPKKGQISNVKTYSALDFRAIIGISVKEAFKKMTFWERLTKNTYWLEIRAREELMNKLYDRLKENKNQLK